MRWQCRVRQMAMREAQGRPGAAIMPDVFLDEGTEPFGQIITVLSKNARHSVIPELKHLGQSTYDPAQRRDKAITFFSASYYQKHREFEPALTASFQPGSEGAAAILAAGSVRLRFEAYAQMFDLRCDVRKLAEQNPLHQATWWHNFLFNPRLDPQAVILSFTPDWTCSSASPPIGGGR